VLNVRDGFVGILFLIKRTIFCCIPKKAFSFSKKKISNEINFLFHFALHKNKLQNLFAKQITNRNSS
jgi:hypothetical protein